MAVLGSTNIILKTKTHRVQTQALVTTGLAHPVLLSWHDLIGLGIINNCFPAPLAMSAKQPARWEISTLTNNIIERFPAVFQDSLGDKPMSTEEVHLHLRQNATPFRVSAARQIPLRFREPAEACVKELLMINIITPCHEPTE